MLHHYRYIQRIKRRRPPVPLLRGRIIGELLDQVWADQDLTPVVDKYEKEFGHIFREERELYGNLLEESVRIATGYAEFYDEQPYRLVATEEKIEFELSPGITFIGYIDKHLERLDDKSEWVLDHKSHKRMPDEDSRFADLQLVFYSWGGHVAGLYKKPPGIVWDYLRTKPPTIPEVLANGKGLSKRMNIDTTPRVYREAIRKNGFKLRDYADILQHLRGNTASFYRRVILPPPNRDMVNSVVRDLKVSAAEIKATGDINTVRSMSRDCKSCEFYMLCASEVRGLDTAYMRAKEFEPRKGDDRGNTKESEEADSSDD